jgi:hypothetical protein
MSICTDGPNVKTNILSKTFNNLSEIHTEQNKLLERKNNSRARRLTSSIQIPDKDAHDAQKFFLGGQCVFCLQDPLVSIY